MSGRIADKTERGAPFTISLDGETITAYNGETVAAALVAHGAGAFRRDKSGAPRAPYCNMGVCFDCLVYVENGQDLRRLRACMTPAVPSMIIRREPRT